MQRRANVAELVRVHARREMITRMEKTIQDALSRAWDEDEPGAAEADA